MLYEIVLGDAYSLLLTVVAWSRTPNLPTNIVDSRGFDSSIILIQRGGILRSIGNFPESWSQAMLVGTMLVGRLGVQLVAYSRCLIKNSCTWRMMIQYVSFAYRLDTDVCCGLYVESVCLELKTVYILSGARKRPGSCFCKFLEDSVIWCSTDSQVCLTILEN